MADPTDDDRKRAYESFSDALRTMAGTTMRVARGTGSPTRIGHQLYDVVEPLQAFRSVIGRYPRANELKSILTVSRAPPLLKGGYSREAIFVELIVRNALQVAASRLLGQVSQEQRAEMDILLNARARSDYLNELRRGQ